MNEKLAWLQALRGTAALMVVFFHLSPHWALVPQLRPFTQITNYGFCGVDIFFVLSGFVVYESAVRSIPFRGLFHFLRRRFSRIYFLYWPTFVIFTCVAVFVLHTQPKSTTQLFFSFFLLYPSIWDNWIPVAWSLTSELYFYLILGLLIFFFKKNHIKAIGLVLFFLLTWHLSWLIFLKPQLFSGEQPFRYALSGLIIEFLAGALIAATLSNREIFHRRPRLFIIAAAAVAVFCFFIGSTSPYYDRVEIMRAGSYGLAGASLLIIALALQNCKAKAPKFLVGIGNMSFSIYLIHTLIISLMGFLRHYFFSHSPDMIFFLSLTIPLIVLFASYFLYIFVEKPSIALANKDWGAIRTSNDVSAASR